MHTVNIRRPFLSQCSRKPGAGPPLSCRHRLQTWVIKAAAGDRKQLPIFPLNVVAMPHAVMPLMIFEARYRVLFNTLLAGSDNVEEGLVQADSPYAGTKRFGMCYVDESGRLSAIGTTLEIQDFVRESSGRIYVTNKGIERFKVTKVVNERPVLLCEVEVLPEDDNTSEEAKQLAAEVADLFRNVLRLHLKMNRNKTSRRSSGGRTGLSPTSTADQLSSEAEDESLEALELTESSPQQLSFWIAHVFSESKYTQQALLEEDNTIVRLTAEKKLLSSTLKYYTAATALEGVFGGGGGGGGGETTTASSEVQPPPGGPD